MFSSTCSVEPAISAYSGTLPRIKDAQTLLFDADDTLWENNILFERAMDQFVRMLAHPTMTPLEVREAFNHLERDRVQVHGYGTRSFHASLIAGYELLTHRPCEKQDRAHIGMLADEIVTAPIELLPHVAETLEALSAKHTLVLVTKGDREEQVGKLERSGLSSLFDHTEVVREKHRQVYLDLRSHHSFDRATTWMIGNSPKSDINPALAAGLNAIFIPHANTWVLEHEAIHFAPAGQHLLILERISALRGIFLDERHGL